MKNRHARARTALLVPLLGTLTACVGTVGYGGGYGSAYEPGYYDNGGIGYVGGYYQPYGYDWGGWGPGYHVGPPRGGERSVGQAGGYDRGSARHGSPGRTIPGIAHGSRDGGGRSSHGGAGRGGGGGGHGGDGGKHR